MTSRLLVSLVDPSAGPERRGGVGEAKDIKSMPKETELEGGDLYIRSLDAPRFPHAHCHQ